MQYANANMEHKCFNEAQTKNATLIESLKEANSVIINNANYADYVNNDTAFKDNTSYVFSGAIELKAKETFLIKKTKNTFFYFKGKIQKKGARIDDEKNYKTVDGSTFYIVKADNLHLKGAPNNQIMSSANRNGTTAFNIRESTRVVMTGVNFSNNGLGIKSMGNDSVTIMCNKANGISSRGIQLLHTANAKILNNTIHNVGVGGFKLAFNYENLQTKQISGGENDIKAHSDGIDLDAKNTNIQVKGNLVQSNARACIFCEVIPGIENKNITISNNLCVGNPTMKKGITSQGAGTGCNILKNRVNIN